MNRKSIKMLVTGVLASGAIMTALAATAVERHGALTTDGKHILNKNGNIVQLRGMSFYWSNPDWNGYNGFYTESMVGTLVDQWKCTVVRAAYDPGTNGLSGVQAVIDAAIKKGIYVIIDWHSHTAHSQASAAIDFFKQKAQQYKNTPNVIFEPYNEPISLDGNKTDGSQTKAEATWKGIKGYLRDVTQAIRDAGADNLVILGTPFFCQFVNVASDDPIVDKSGKPFKNIAYAFHFYAASHGPFSYYVKESGNGGMESSYLAAGLGNVPVFVSEWGTTHSDGSKQLDAENTDWWFKEYLNGKYHLSWCNWSVSSFESSSCFQSGGTSPSASGTIVRKYLLNQSTDEYELESKTGKAGPAGTTVFDMPGTHPAANYNLYYGANVSVVAVPFLDWDEKDVRTAANKCVKVLPGASGDWIAYSFKCASATSKVAFRYLAKNGSGTLAVSLDGQSAGTLTISKEAGWVTKVVDVAVSAGTHELKITFNSSVDDGYLIEWIELANAVAASRKTVVMQSAMPVTFASSGNRLCMTLPDGHNITGYRVMTPGGRLAGSGMVNSASRNVNIQGLPAGIFFVELAGSPGGSPYRVMINGQ